MEYFYDHQTDCVSLILSDAFDFSRSEELAPGIVAYLDGASDVIAIEIRGAGKILDTKGLVPMYARPISADELKKRLFSSTVGQLAWRSVDGRLVAAV